MQTILKKRLDLRKVCARWVPHLLTEEQKTQRLKCARELLKTYKGCNSRGISSLLTGDEKVFKSFLASEEVKVLNHPPYSPDLSPCDFFYFKGLGKCFLEISLRLEVLLTSLFISVFTKRRLFICFSRLGKKVTKMCFSKGGIL